MDTETATFVKQIKTKLKKFDKYLIKIKDKLDVLLVDGDKTARKLSKTQAKLTKTRSELVITTENLKTSDMKLAQLAEKLDLMLSTINVQAISNNDYIKLLKENKNEDELKLK